MSSLWMPLAYEFQSVNPLRDIADAQHILPVNMKGNIRESMRRVYTFILHLRYVIIHGCHQDLAAS